MIFAFLLSLLLSVAHAEAPRATREIGVDEQLGARVPDELVFVTPDGTPHQLSEYVRTGKPTLLVFAYARCRALCSVVLQSTGKLLSALPELAPGRDFQPLLIGLDPQAQLEDGRRQRDAFARSVHWSPDAVTYLFGKQAQIEALARAVGYRYRWDASTEQYAHPAVLIVLDGEGRVQRYLHALGSSADELASALRGEQPPPIAHEASLAGELLRCFRFDPSLRRHQRTIELYFRLGGALIFALLAGLVVGLLRWERRRRA